MFATRDYFNFAREMSWRPATTASYVVDLAVWGRRPSGFHLTNLFLHLAAVFLFWRLARRTTGSPGAALAGSLAVLVHPAAGSAVCLVGFREELLVAVGILGALECVRFPRTVRWGRYGGWAMVAGVCAAVALLAKETGVLLPAISVVLWVGLRRKGWPPCAPAFRTAVLIFLQALLVLGYLGLYFGPFHSLLGVASNGAPRAMGPFQGFSTFLWVHVRYVWMMIWPFGWAPHHPIDPISLGSDPRWVLGGFLLAAVVGMGFLGLIRGRWSAIGGVGLLWWSLSLAPVSGVAPLPNPMADRYLYLPLFGLGWVAAWGWWTLRRRVRCTGISRKHKRTLLRLAGLLAAGIGLFWVRQSVTEVLIHRTTFSLWTATLQVEPQSTRALKNLALDYLDKGRYQQASDSFHRYLAVEPNDWEAMISLGKTLDLMKRHKDAESWFRKAVKSAQHQSAAHEALIYHFLFLRPPDRARARYALQSARESFHVAVDPDLARRVDETEPPASLQSDTGAPDSGAAARPSP